MLSTWSFGQKANAAGWPALQKGDTVEDALNAVERAARAMEEDETNMTVGRGGYPDRLGDTTLDALIMQSPARSGAVAYVRRHTHAITLARHVMEKTIHKLLAGEGADRFGKLMGMEPVDLSTDASRAAYEKWMAEHPDAVEDNEKSFIPQANIEEASAPGSSGDGCWTDLENLPHNRVHDTIGVLAQTAEGKLAGACSTSGWAFKVPGRVGDSPGVGHGLFVDPDHGAAVVTGTGELAMGVCATFLAVELMRNGSAPLQAATDVLHRIADSFDLGGNHQLGVITLRADGEWACASLREGFSTAVRTEDRDEMVPTMKVVLG